MPKIAIIGAGCSGLSAIKKFLDEGLTDLVCFEKNERLGGNWVYTAGTGHSSVCETTHIISSKVMSQFEDFPMPAEYPDYPSHSQILAYFEDYARTFGLEKYIRFRTAVEKAQPTPDGRWRLELSDGRESEFDCLVVANGHHAVPRHPEWAKQFAGAYYHAHDFKNNLHFADQRVLVVGAGNSGCDCAVECSRVAARVDISVRSPQYIIPKFFMGKPTDTFAKNMHGCRSASKTRCSSGAFEYRLADTAIMVSRNPISRRRRRTRPSTANCWIKYAMARCIPDQALPV